MSAAALRTVIVGGVTLFVSLLFATAAPASAHVTADASLHPARGGYGQVRLLVPSEENNTTTVAVGVTFPKETNLESVRTLPIPGWTATIEYQKGTSTQRVSRVIWRADSPDDGLTSAQFGVFTLSGGPWPTAEDEVSLATEQRYANGTVVNWNEVALDSSSEPEHPAPQVRLGPATADADHDDHGAAADDPAETNIAEARHHDSSEHDHQTSWWWPTVSVASLVVAIAAIAGLAVLWRRGPRPPA
ncbi:MAG: YcnI family protein [Gordonia sp. (in: high G+C Gram-positive bacteria)]